MANFSPFFLRQKSVLWRKLDKYITYIYRDSDDPDYDHELIYFPYLDCLEMDHPDLINIVKVIYQSLYHILTPIDIFLNFVLKG